MLNFSALAIVFAAALATPHYPNRMAGVSEYAIGRVVVLGGSVTPSPPEPRPMPRPKPNPEPQPNPQPTPKVCQICNNTGKVRSPEGFVIGDCTNPDCPVKKGEVPFAWVEGDANYVLVYGVRTKRLPPESLKTTLSMKHQESKWISKQTFQICYGGYCRRWNFPDDLATLNLVSEKYPQPPQAEKKQ